MLPCLLLLVTLSSSSPTSSSMSTNGSWSPSTPSLNSSHRPQDDFLSTWLEHKLSDLKPENHKGKNVLQMLQTILHRLGFNTNEEKHEEEKNHEEEILQWRQCPEDECPHQRCGVPNRMGRVVNGSTACVHEFPWMASIHLRLSNSTALFQCGGVLINDQYVITAAHCLHRQEARHLLVRLGQHMRNVSAASEQSKRVTRIVRHHRYKADTFDNDIALLKLRNRVKLSAHVRSVCLDTKPNSYKGRVGLIAGWGRTQPPSASSPSSSSPSASSPSSSSSVLQKAPVHIFGHEECVRDFKYAKSEIKDSMLCAGHRDARHDACLGDSGGPLMVLDDDLHHFKLAGLISWGHGCAAKGYPGVYARISSFLTWIRDHTTDACFCH